MIEVRVILDSVSPTGQRLTTLALRYMRFIHAELMTHRVISRNASSSRAVPTAKLLEEVRSDELRATPIWWGKNQSGMQAAEELSDRGEDEVIVDRTAWTEVLRGTPKELARELWNGAAHDAAEVAECLVKLGAHKQIVNRILEPFTHINVVATATEWDNFFGLRLHKDAQPEIRALAVAMWEARKASTPKLLQPGEWHLPFVDAEDLKMCAQRALEYHSIGSPGSALANPSKTTEHLAIKVSVARCARVSYLSHETGRRSTVDEDLKLYERLVGSQPMHASPAEHQATPDEPEHCYDDLQCGDCENASWNHRREWGNLVGWRQYRKMLPGESRAPLPEDYCLGHAASDGDPKVCRHCGVRIDELRPPEDGEML